MEESKHLVIPTNNSIQLPNRYQLVEWVRQWGGSTSDALLAPEIILFTLPSIDGFIAYRLRNDCAAVYGDPTCAAVDIPVLTNAFHQHMDKRNVSIIYLIASQSFTHWAMKNVCNAMLEFGEELTLNPLFDPSKISGENGRLVRKKIKHATREGVTVHEYLQGDAELEQSIEEVGKQWLNSRRGHQFHICNLSLLNDRVGKRWFYAMCDNKMVGIVILNQFKAKGGWFLNNLMIIPTASHGTSELLVITAIKTLADEGCEFVTLGTVTNKVPGEIIGLNKFSAGIVRLAFKLAIKLGNLEGLNIFWSKFNPDRVPSYILFSGKSIGLKELLAIKNASYGGKR